MLEEGTRPGDLEVDDLEGHPCNLRRFRRRTHVVLLWVPGTAPEELARWRKRRQDEAGRWTWLAAELVVPRSPLANAAPGIYLISRWGKVIGVHPPGAWDMDRIERDLLTFEARDSCE